MTSDFMKWIEANVVPEIKKKYKLKITPDTLIYAGTWETRYARFDRLQRTQGQGDPWLSGWVELVDEYGNKAEFTWRKSGKKIIVEKEPGFLQDLWGVRK